MTTMVAILFSIILVVSPVMAGGSSDIGLFAGAWTGEWKSDKGDKAPMRAIVTVDAATNLVMLVMFQVPAPPAPSFSSLSIGKVNESGNLIIDAASSGIEGGGSEMKFWMEGPLVLRGSYKNQYDSGSFTFRRFSPSGA
ncbi:MAG: hypothetical protein UT16_C0014G0011 [Candidatus Azambacteria bacterium GW2011_GWA2_39_10]|uniref:Uncharacterized protein n=1 Tax=Candidatus Azambacteria bacterium GW2011_GWA2_39_10 TaxID=1618611 RepID=A0A0G0LTZ4_9BACT|nr:MAG: hypothetical protein UT16_C0014G0011 [Candidatus Azambacteria bacterium GW2011_GWA2_39_10]